MPRKKKRDVPAPSRPKKPSMQDRGFKALTVFVKLATYYALERHGKDAKIKHSAYLRQLVEEDLRRKGYLPPIPKAESRRKGSEAPPSEERGQTLS